MACASVPKRKDSMTPEQAAAFIHAQAVAALSEIEAMKAANYTREQQGHTHAYGEDAFRQIQSDYVITHNSVLDVLHTSNNH